VSFTNNFLLHVTKL